MFDTYLLNISTEDQKEDFVINFEDPASLVDLIREITKYSSAHFLENLSRSKFSSSQIQRWKDQFPRNKYGAYARITEINPIYTDDEGEEIEILVCLEQYDLNNSWWWTNKTYKGN